MREYLILRLAGPMQAWGQPTFEGTRPSATFPTRSGLLGLLGACLGIHRSDKQALQSLANSVRFAVRCDLKDLNHSAINVTKITDYHTVKDARENYRGLKHHDTIQTWREYLCDAAFTIAVWLTPEADLSMVQLVEAVKKPLFTPYLGRRSCPLTHPLYLNQISADDPKAALTQQLPSGGTIYSEEPIDTSDRRFRVRDEPMINLPRQFSSREWFVSQGGEACI